MNIELDCPSCPNRLVFAARRTRSHGRLIGSCAGCRSVFTLYGGRISPIDAGVTRRHTAPAWAFNALVARERRVANELHAEGAPPAALAD